MTNLLGIDFGLSKVGIAIANRSLAEPFQVIKYVDIRSLIKQIVEICGKEKIEKIIIGISEGKMEENSKDFAESLKEKINIPIELFDETLSTQDAQRLAIEAGIKRSKRKALEDAWAATLMLQNYLDQSKIY